MATLVSAELRRQIDDMPNMHASLLDALNMLDGMVRAAGVCCDLSGAYAGIEGHARIAIEGSSQHLNVFWYKRSEDSCQVIAYIL